MTHPSLGVLEGEILVGKAPPIDALPTRAVSPRKVSPLCHEIGDHSVHPSACVAHNRQIHQTMRVSRCSG